MELSLPVQEEILLSLSTVKDLSKACFVFRPSFSFWKEKFRREGLPLLKEGTNVSSWLRIYKKSKEVAREVDRELNSACVIDLRLSELKDPNPLLCLDEAKKIIYYWKSMQHVSFADFRLQFIPSSEREKYDYFLLSRFSRGTDEASIMGIVNKCDLWFILYNTYYHDWFF
jgi:hypothetical protein